MVGELLSPSAVMLRRAISRGVNGVSPGRAVPLRVAICAILATGCLDAQTAAYRWIKQVGGSGNETLAGIATDRQGNTYVAGSTTSLDLPVVNAIQPHPGGSGIFRVDGPGSNWHSLYQSGIAGTNALVADLRDPRVIYAAGTNTLVRSSDGGDTWQTVAAVPPGIGGFAVALDGAIYLAAFRSGMLKSLDGGATFTPVNNGIPIAAFAQPYVWHVWTDPFHANVLFAEVGTSTAYSLARSADAGASWQLIPDKVVPGIGAVTFDPITQGKVYTAGDVGAAVSLDDGVTWSALGRIDPQYPAVSAILADSKRPGVLYTSSQNGLWKSTDSGATWTRKITLPAPIITQDPSTGTLYASQLNGIIASTDGFETFTKVGPPVVNTGALVAAGGKLFVGAATTSDVFIAKLDRDGNTVWATYLGGSATEVARAMTVDDAGAVYVTGVTQSQDFPVSSGAYASSGASFVSKLNPDGSLAWSTYFAGQPNAIAVDTAGHAFIAGVAYSAIPTTPGAYQTNFDGKFCGIGCLISFPPTNGFVTEFDSSGASLVFSTLLGAQTEFISAMAVLPDGSVVAAGQQQFYKLDPTGSTLLMGKSLVAVVQSLRPDGAGNLLVTGLRYYAPAEAPFPSTPGAVQPSPYPPTGGGSLADAYVMRVDSNLNVLTATLLGGEGQDVSFSAAAAPDGSVVVGGSTNSKAFPTTGELQSTFASQTGFLSRLSGDFSALLFSSFMGDSRQFYVKSVAVTPDGGAEFGGTTRNPTLLVPFQLGSNGLDLFPGASDKAFVVRVDPVQPAGPRVDSVVNAASYLAAQLSLREAIQVRGAGFSDDAVLLLNGNPLPLISHDASTLTAELPADFNAAAATLEVVSSGVRASVAVSGAIASPAIFSRDGSGTGQAWVLNKDGSVNSGPNPAHEGDPITIFITGMGPMSFDHGYAVTDTPIVVAVDGFYANGIAAVLGPVDGLPGEVYQVSVYVPRPSDFADQNPNLKNFVMPSQSPLRIAVGDFASQSGIYVSVTH
jgi:uncharacterized protein (TIGR03437 family)